VEPKPRLERRYARGEVDSQIKVVYATYGVSPFGGADVRAAVVVLRRRRQEWPAMAKTIKTSATYWLALAQQAMTFAGGVECVHINALHCEQFIDGLALTQRTTRDGAGVTGVHGVPFPVAWSASLQAEGASTSVRLRCPI
jgi:hypothetical protein